MHRMKKTPLHDAHRALNARMGPFGGWDMPIQYEGILAEHEHTRKAVSAFDICHMGEFDLRGPTAESDLERLLTQRVSTIAIGQCRYGYLLREDGGVLDDLTCYRLAADRFYLVVNAGTLDQDREWIRSHLSPATTFTDVSGDTGKIDVQGPASRAAMESALNVKLPDLKYFRAEEVTLLGAPCLLSRTGYTGEWGYELYMPTSKTRMFWDALLSAGQIKPAGLGARDTLRLEVGYPLYGHELSVERTPAAATRGSFVDITKDFIGKAAVVRDLDHGCPRYLAGLRLESRRAARAHDKVLHQGAAVGEVTSGSVAPSLGVAIAFAYINANLCAPGTEVELDVHGKPLPAVVVEIPFYKDGTARRR